MNILDKLSERWIGINYPFLIHANGSLRFDEVASQQHIDLSEIKSGDVVALIGDFNPQSILTLLHLIDKNVILVDDVLYTGRTTRAALDTLLDFGRPNSVEFLVLIDRRFSRDLPIQANYVGKTIDSIDSENRFIILYFTRKSSLVSGLIP